ncbi:Auxin Efflux Carrier family protein [Tritrichomonas foetus]|uniref:Auxin Efflux Carrier family protein n=1 Tax=Tritrichomonas foetus TaxID=1144522 RepID=A0A1J4KUE6_9EUKA|nr:Auxin Efflux Carrier family protein [Tritrichomonas foetus]|eukprot:OHT14762.1 Auxin Efflux Carrier family protein [Tritrichomonas foetus]
MVSFYIDVLQAGVSCLMVIGVGFILSKFKIFEPDEFNVFNSINSKICLPFLLFRSLASRKMKDLSFMPLVNALLMSASTQLLVAISCAIFPFPDKLATYLSTVISSVYINYIIIGLPIFNSIWGTMYNHIPAICTFTHYILLVPVYIILAQIWQIKQNKALEHLKEPLTQNHDGENPIDAEKPITNDENSKTKKEEEDNDKKVDKKVDDKIEDKQKGKNENKTTNNEGSKTKPAVVNDKITIKDIGLAFYTTIKTPLVIGNVLGLVWSAIGIDYYPFFQQLGKYMGDVVLVFALVSIGRFLQVNSLLSCHWAHLLICLFIRCFVCPGFSALYAYALNFDGRLARQCIVLSSLPAANAGFVLANSMGIGANVASAMVFWSLIIIVPVLIFWFFIFNHFNLFPEIDEI